MPGLVNIQKAMENGHRNSGFSHEKWWIFTLQTVSSLEGMLICAQGNHKNCLATASLNMLIHG